MKLLTVCSETPGLDRFEQSTKELDKVSIRLDEYPGHVKRWNYVPSNLDGQIIFSDTDDVIYQGDVPEMTSIITSPENILHKDTLWKKWCVDEYEVLLNQPVYNVGLFSMPAKELYDYIKFSQTKERVWDQIAFNLWLLNKKHTPRADIFLCLYNNLEFAQKQDGIWYIGGCKASFVHANGNNKELL